MKKLISCTLVALGVSLSSAADAPLVLDQVLQEARVRNPDIVAAQQAWKVKAVEVGPAGTWEYPTFSYTDERFPPGIAGVPTETVHHYRFEQKIPFPGKLTDEERMKNHEALIAEADYRAKMLEVLKDVCMNYYQLYLTDQQIALAEASVGILQNALRTAQSRLASGQSSALDVFMVQTELAKAENNQYQLEQERKLIAYELNTLLNQDPETSLGAATPPELVDLPTGMADFQALAKEQDPLYRSSLHEVNHARVMLSHNRLEWAPDFGVMVEKETSPAGPDGRQIGVSVSLPLWFWRPWSEVKSAKEHLSEAEARSQSMQNMVAKMVAIEFTETTTRLAISRRYQSEIVPSALSALKIAEGRYASGQDDFMRLLEAYREWITSNNEYQEQLYQYGEHWSLLEQWVGLDLSGVRGHHE